MEDRNTVFYDKFSYPVQSKGLRLHGLDVEADPSVFRLLTLHYQSLPLPFYSRLLTVVQNSSCWSDEMFSTVVVLHLMCSLALLSLHHAPSLFCTKSAYISILRRQAREILWYFPVCCPLVLSSRSLLKKKNIEIKVVCIAGNGLFSALGPHPHAA